MSQVEIPKFNSPQEEIIYWKKQLEDKQQDLDEIETNFSEYQEFSKQLEEEMESELKGCEKKYAEMQSQHSRLKNDHENIIEKLNEKTKESSKLINTLQDEIAKLQQSKQNLIDNRRKLEQENDYLERREREATATINDLTDKLDRVVEENVWMQSELEEAKLAADETIQRLRDDIKELKQELILKERRKPIFKNSNNNSNSNNSNSNNSNNNNNNNNNSNNINNNNSSIVSSTTTTTIEKVKEKRENPLSMNITRPNKSQRNRVEDNATSKRAGSLVLVTDLINLVTDLENKISNFKSQKPIISSPSSSITNLLASSSSDTNISALLNGGTNSMNTSSPRLLHSSSLINFQADQIPKKLVTPGNNSLLNSFIEVQKQQSPITTTGNNNLNNNDFQNNNKEPFING